MGLERKDKNTYEKLVGDKERQLIDGTNNHSPEAIFISAMIDSGSYIPAMYGIKSEFFSAHKPIHEFCLRYQADSNEAPKINVLLEHYGSFPYLPGVNPQWAANRLSDAHNMRVLRKTIMQASASVEDESLGEAISILNDGLNRIQPAIGMGIDATDFSVLEEFDHLEMCPVPEGKISDLTGGIAPGDLWFVAARLGIGKSWRMIQHAVAAAEGGWNVAYFSLEMPAKSVLERIHRVALRSWTKPWIELTMDKRKEMMEHWAQGSGSISIYDPSNGRCDATVLSSVAHEKTLLIVDYVGLMHTTSGTRAIEDWRAMASISNQLKEVALNRNVPIIAAAQINRAGDKVNGTPGPEHLAQSDALGQDADALITLVKHSSKVSLNSLSKYRHGESGTRWFSLFDPSCGNFKDISIEKANEYRMRDDQLEISQIG